MLTGFRIRNFRSFVSADVSFQPQHLIVGRNNSGKTNLVRALRFLSATAGGDLASAAAWVPGGIAELPNWTLKTDRIELGCDCVLEIGAWEGTYSYDLELHVNRPTEVYPQAPLTLTVAKESLRAQGRDWKEPLQLISRNGSKATVLNPEPNGRCGKPEEVFPRPDATLLESLHQAQQGTPDRPREKRHPRYARGRRSQRPRRCICSRCAARGISSLA
jgi:predicted ATPase